MSDPRTADRSDERLLTFEIGATLYALPIAGVLEVIETEPVACIPTLPPRIAGVANYHGDALPVMRRSALLDVDESVLPDPEQVLVLTDRAGNSARLGRPVDRVLGLVEGAAAASTDEDPVAERRPMDGQVVNILDPARLVAKASEVIERMLGTE